MGLFDLFKKKDKSVVGTENIQEERGILLQPTDGEIISLQEIGDGIFSEGILGKGCGLKPSGEEVYAPIRGRISTVADTKHAVGITGDDGLELLIHVGIDTVDMNGNGFFVSVKEGDQVKRGQKLLEFSRKAIADAGHSDTIAILVTNSDEYKEINLIHTGNGKVGEPIIKIKK